MHLKGLVLDVSTARRPLQKMFGLRGKISSNLISIHMPLHGVTRSCQASLSLALYCYRLMCAGEEELHMSSLNGITGRSVGLAVKSKL